MSRRRDYRAAVGPKDKYDIIGAMQFCRMVEMGLREYHTLLDIGCGSLRGGRFFIPYLEPGGYFGLEPDQDLVWLGLAAELGQEIVAIKKPRFLYDSDFSLTSFGVMFDYVLAQSIFSHAPKQQIEKCLSELRLVLNPVGTFLGTYFIGTADYEGESWAQQPDARYTEGWMSGICAAHGLAYKRLPWPHPSHQTWFKLQHIGMEG